MYLAEEIIEHNVKICNQHILFSDPSVNMSYDPSQFQQRQEMNGYNQYESMPRTGKSGQPCVYQRANVHDISSWCLTAIESH